MRWVGLTSIRVSELWMPPRRPVVSAFGTFTDALLGVVACSTVPSGIRWVTIARSDHDAVAVDRLDPVVVAHADLRRRPAGLIHIVGPPRDSDSMNRLSWYSEWMDHFECGVR